MSIRGRPLIIWGDGENQYGKKKKKKRRSEGLQEKKLKQKIPQEKKINIKKSGGTLRKKKIAGPLPFRPFRYFRPMGNIGSAVNIGELEILEVPELSELSELSEILSELPVWIMVASARGRGVSKTP